MSRKSLAANGERELLNDFWRNGFAGVRTPSSGSGTLFPRPDLIIGNGANYYALELKTVRKNNKVYIDKAQIDGLITFAETFGAIPFLAIKFMSAKLGFRFFNVIEYPFYTTKKQAYRVTLEECKKVALTFEQLIKN